MQSVGREALTLSASHGCSLCPPGPRPLSAEATAPPTAMLVGSDVEVRCFASMQKAVRPWPAPTAPIAARYVAAVQQSPWRISVVTTVVTCTMRAAIPRPCAPSIHSRNSAARPAW
eukprot:scaffold4280_cov385-Prasinococcus_capsulatus_cf.AAC.3